MFSENKLFRLTIKYPTPTSYLTINSNSSHKTFGGGLVIFVGKRGDRRG